MRRGVSVAGIALFLCVLAAVLCAGQGAAQQTMDDCFITREELKKMLGNPDVTLIDMRFGRDWTEAKLKIQGAVREDPMKPGQWIDKYPKDKTLVFYWTWPKDATSTSLVRMFKVKGFASVFALKGGFSDWIAAGYPTEPK